jgi:hypothetical protein
MWIPSPQSNELRRQAVWADACRLSMLLGTSTLCGVLTLLF